MNDQGIHLILVRHGAIGSSGSQPYWGQKDMPLNTAGLQQVEKLVRGLQNFKFHGIYTSDLQRAIQTAEPIARVRGLTLQTTPALRELHFGEWTGLTYQELLERDPETYERWLQRPLQIRPPKGESLKELKNRVLTWFYAMLKTHNPDETVLLVGHSGSLKMILFEALNLSLTSFWRMELGPASVSRLTYYENTCVVHTLNDTCHLR
ncbi:MAG TPA: histidine phosphatase family protein [Candidatus Limnocylindrales bacterium]|nr:histidine phosphatase family protein [Candidatus Limnocylindrales bacterium]